MTPPRLPPLRWPGRRTPKVPCKLAVKPMILADITISTEAMVVVGGVVAAMASALTYLFTMVTGNRSAELANQRDMYERRIAAVESDKKSWMEMTQELGINIEKAVNRKRAIEGMPPFKIIEPIVPEHSSPVTTQQQNTADIGTMRARLVAAAEELNLPPRPTPPPADDAAAAAVANSAAAHAKSGTELSKAVAADAISDATAAIEVAAVATDAAAVAIGPGKDKEEKQP